MKKKNIKPAYFHVTISYFVQGRRGQLLARRKPACKDRKTKTLDKKFHPICRACRAKVEWP